MNNKVFKFNANEVRTVLKDGDPYFCASDVGKVLGLSNVYRQISVYDRGVHLVHTLTNGGMQDIIYISEGNLYRLIFKSRKHDARLFQDWIMDIVLPELRKKGTYSIPESLKSKSKEDRKLLTQAWKESGVEKRYHFIQLTLQEYKSLGFDKDTRKDTMNKEELLLLNALESMEALRLFHDPKEGYYQCKDSLNDTGKKIKVIIENKDKGELN